jgi:hypothetical protein
MDKVVEWVGMAPFRLHRAKPRSVAVAARSPRPKLGRLAVFQGRLLNPKPWNL